MEDLNRLKQYVSPAIEEAFAMCEGETKILNCTTNVRWLARRVASTAERVHNEFSLRPYGAKYDQTDCDDLRKAMTIDPPAISDLCNAAGEWPPRCAGVELALKNWMASTSWEMGVACSILSPGKDKQYMPKCADLVRATVADNPTLTSCQSVDNPTCIANFCNMYSTFQWRIRPRQWQKDTATVLYPDNFVLPGCEAIAALETDPETCHLREDVRGFCDCLCAGEGLQTITPIDGYDCQENIDEYMVFGRLKATGVKLSMACQPQLCDLLDSRRGKAECALFDLPKEEECTGMVLSKAPENCMWQQDSGNESVMECLDGHKCRIDQEEDWTCCESHLGRARCPSEKPVMCDTLCSGGTEYCCKEQGSCTPRGCSPLLSPRLEYFAVTSTTTYTTPPPGDGANHAQESNININVRIPGGQLAWLLLIIPVWCMCCGIFLYIRFVLKKPQEVVGPAADMDEDADKFGAFYVVKPKPVPWDKELKRQVVEIVLDHLPNTRPLGIELLEMKVVRVHPQGSKYGWKVGDVIVEIAGVSVETFEDLWARIQVERDRPPVRFMVERCGERMIDAEERAEMQMARDMAQVAEVKKRHSSSKALPGFDQALSGRKPMTAWGGATEPSPAERGLPSALVGWDAWTQPPEVPCTPATTAVDVDEDIDDGDEAGRARRQRRKAREMADKARADEKAAKAEARAKAESKRQNRDLASTGFMRAFPLTPAAQVLRAIRRKDLDPSAEDVRWRTDAWGRHVIQATAQLRDSEFSPRDSSNHRGYAERIISKQVGPDPKHHNLAEIAVAIAEQVSEDKCSETCWPIDPDPTASTSRRK